MLKAAFVTVTCTAFFISILFAYMHAQWLATHRFMLFCTLCLNSVHASRTREYLFITLNKKRK